jgi:hypothetical protein
LAFGELQAFHSIKSQIAVIDFKLFQVAHGYFCQQFGSINPKVVER